MRLKIIFSFFLWLGFLGLSGQESEGKSFHVNEKGQIIDAKGKEFVPFGANVAISFTGFPFVFEGNHGSGEPDLSGGGVNTYERWSAKANKLIQVPHKGKQLKAWGFNTLRVTAVPHGEKNNPSIEQTIGGLKKGIDEMTQLGFVVILEMHSCTGKDPKVGDELEKSVRKIWDELVPYYKNNGYVWFNFFNEPFKDRKNIQGWVDIHEDYIHRYRNEPYSANNIIVCDLPGYGQGLDVLADGKLDVFYKKHKNISFSWHAYGSVGDKLNYEETSDIEKAYKMFDQLLLQIKEKNYSLMVGELGIATPKNHGNAGPWQWNINGFRSLVTGTSEKGVKLGEPLGHKYNLGLQLWHLTGDSAFYHLYSVRTDREPWWTTINEKGELIFESKLSEQGKMFWDYAQKYHIQK